MTKQKRTAEIIGWIGMVAILLAYALVSFKIISSSGYAYQLLNLVGAVGIIVISVVKKVRQSEVLNIAWAVIALVAIIGLITH